MYYSQAAPLAIYVQGEFGKGHSKTAEGVIRYGRNPVVAVIDASEAGRPVESVVGIPCAAPIVASIEESLPFKPRALLLGGAWTGGRLPAPWRADIIKALRSGLDVINGLHDFLDEDEEIRAEAERAGRLLLDVRKPPADLPVAAGRALAVPGLTVLTVGSDCSVGKMTTALEVVAGLSAASCRAGFVATGQTGIMIAGRGIAIDRVIGDFMAGAVEAMVVEEGERSDYVLVEGQGSLVHPGFSGVTLALLHGAAPAAMILCHKAGKEFIGETAFRLPSLAKLIEIYESMAAHIRPAPVVGIALNTRGFSDQEARDLIAAAARETGLASCDPVRFGSQPLVDALIQLKERMN